MKRTSVFVTIGFLAGLAVGFFAHSAYTGVLQRRTHAADFAAIEKAHQGDIEATTDARPEEADRPLGGGCGELHSGKPACGRQAGH